MVHPEVMPQFVRHSDDGDQMIVHRYDIDTPRKLVVTQCANTSKSAVVVLKFETGEQLTIVVGIKRTDVFMTPRVEDSEVVQTIDFTILVLRQDPMIPIGHGDLCCGDKSERRLKTREYGIDVLDDPRTIVFHTTRNRGVFHGTEL
jgi:hypothetical protein